MSDLCPPYGFALRRRGTCREDEVGTTETWDGFHRCCPKPSIENNGACCPENTDCREELGSSRHCADSNWLLFRNTKDNGYFCCLNGQDGFLADSNGTAVGCENSFDPDNSNLLWQPRITPGNIHILLTWYDPTSNILRQHWINLLFFFKLGRYRRWRGWWCCWVSNHSCLALVFHASPITEATSPRGNTHYRSISDTIRSRSVFRQTERVKRSTLCGRAGEFPCPRVAGKSKDSVKSYDLHFNFFLIKPKSWFLSMIYSMHSSVWWSRLISSLSPASMSSMSFWWSHYSSYRTVIHNNNHCFPSLSSSVAL